MCDDHGSTRDSTSTVPLLKKAFKSCLAYNLCSQSLGEAIKAMHQCIDPFGLFFITNNLLQLTRRVLDVRVPANLKSLHIDNTHATMHRVVNRLSVGSFELGVDSLAVSATYRLYVS